MPRRIRKKTSQAHAPQAAAGDRRARGMAQPAAQVLLAMALVGVAVAAVHWPALGARALAFDDGIYLTENKLVQNPSWEAAGRFLTEVLEPSTVGGYYQPLAMISLMVDSALGGSPDDLRPYHRTSLLLHAINTGLIVLLIYQLFGNVLTAAMVGLLFGVHPITVEPIPWVGERKTLLAAGFALGAMVCYVRYARQKGWPALTGVYVLYALALMSKPTSTPLPVALLLMDYWPLRRLSKRTTLEKIPLFGLAGLSAVITYVSQAQTSVAALPGEQSPWRIVLTICHNIVFYPLKFIWPTNLTPHYPFPHPFELGNPAVLMGVVGSAVLLGVLVLSLRRTRALAVGWLIFFTIIFPTLGVVGFTNVIASDKYAYLPAVGFLLILGWGLAILWQGLSLRLHPVRGKLAVVVLVLVLAVCESAATRRYLTFWKDTQTLGRRMIELAENSFEARIHYGFALGEAGKTDQAVSQFLKALDIEPYYSKAHYSLAVVYAEQGRLPEAIEHYSLIVRHDQADAQVYNNLGSALLQTGQVEGAAENFRKALELEPGFSDALNNLGAIELSRNKIAQALDYFQRALHADAGNRKAQANLANALAKSGRVDDAIGLYREILTQDPGNVDVRVRLGEALVKAGRLDLAVQQYRSAIGIKPGHIMAHLRLGAALAQLGRFEQAIQSYQQAIRIDPSFAPAHNDLGAMRGRQGRWTDAIGHYRAALQLDPGYAKGYNNLGQALIQIGRVEEAASQFGQAVRLRPDYLSARVNLANALRLLQRFEEALQVCQQAIQMDPGSAVTHFNLGLIHEAAGRPRAALKAYRKTLEISPQHGDARRRVAALSNVGRQ